MKPLLPVVAGVLAGLAAGAIWTWAQADRYRADARVLVRPASARIVPAVEALAESSLVESNVAQTLRLSSPPDVSARTGDGGVLTVSVEARSREAARQIDAEAVAVLMQKVAQRFATTVGVTTTVLDPAHASEQTSPTPGRNGLISVLTGLAAGLAALLAQRRRVQPVASSAADSELEARLQKRVEQVAKRERALAQRAGELASREQDVVGRERELERRSGELEARQRELAARGIEEAAATQIEPAVPEARAEAERPAAPAAAGAPGGRWTLDALEQHVAAKSATSPDRVEEWQTYLFYLRGHAHSDGSLPRSFDSLIADVFDPD